MANPDTKRRSRPAVEVDGRYGIGEPEIKEKPWSIPPEVRVAELNIKRWQIIAGICTLLGGGLTTCAGTAVAVVTALRPKENDVRIDEISKKADGIQDELTALKEQIRLQGTSGPTTRLVSLENKVDYLAVFAAKINGQPPTTDGYPAPLEGVWYQDVSKTKPVPMKMRGGPWPK